MTTNQYFADETNQILIALLNCFLHEKCSQHRDAFVLDQVHRNDGHSALVLRLIVDFPVLAESRNAAPPFVVVLVRRDHRHRKAGRVRKLLEGNGVHVFATEIEIALRALVPERGAKLATELSQFGSF